MLNSEDDQRIIELLSLWCLAIRSCLWEIGYSLYNTVDSLSPYPELQKQVQELENKCRALLEQGRQLPEPSLDENFIEPFAKIFHASCSLIAPINQISFDFYLRNDLPSSATRQFTHLLRLCSDFFKLVGPLTGSLPFMTQPAFFVLENSHLRIELTPEHGASVINCFAKLGERWVPILRHTPLEAAQAGNVSRMASFTLAPYSNRLLNARFNFNGREYQLQPNTPEGHVQHGDVRRRAWQLAHADATSATLNFDSRAFADFNFPFPFTAQIQYTLEGRAFRTRFQMQNVGKEAMPAGFGFHPYFPRRLNAPDEAVEIQARAAGIYPALIPTSAAVPVPPEIDFPELRPLGNIVMNDCRAGWDGRATIRWPRAGVTLELKATEPLRHLVLFSPEGEDYFAVEPVSNATNGFNLLASGVPGHGVVVLQPGEILAGEFSLSVSLTA
jgi:aldose 1-epimerase